MADSSVYPKPVPARKYQHLTRYAVLRHPTNERRLIFQFEDETEYELSVHQCCDIIEMLSSFMRRCIVSEHEMNLGAEARAARAKAEAE